MMTQPTKLHSGSFNLEFKSLLVALAIIFFVNTPVHFIKSEKIDALAQQNQLIKDTIVAKQQLIERVLNISNLTMFKNGELTRSQFNELTHLFLENQSIITTIELREAKGEKPDCLNYSTATNDNQLHIAYSKQTLYNPNQQKLDFYQPVCFLDRLYAFLYLQVDMNQLIQLDLSNTSLISNSGQIIRTNDDVFNVGAQLSNYYSPIWRELSVTNREEGVIEFDSTTMVYTSFTLFNGQKTILLKRIPSNELIPTYFYLVAVLLGLIVGISIYLYQLRKEKRRLTEISYYDQLSGLYNRHYLHKLDNQADITGAYFCCMFDIDHFKNVNDSYGHDIGDQVIKRVAGVIRSRTRATDYCFRIGGEEFLVLIKAAQKETAVQLCERILRSVEQLEQKPKVTISGGVCEMKSCLRDALKCADEKLYQAKEQGRNCVVD